MINEALIYAQQGFSVIPLKPRDKRPLVTWEPFQNMIASISTVKFWWEQWPNANIGIVTGKISGIVVVDCDSMAGLKRVRNYIRATLVGKIPMASTSAGVHLYFKHPMDKFINNRGKMLEDVDVRGDGGYVVAPPSMHSSGKKYSWITAIQADKAAPIPPELLNVILSAPTLNLTEKTSPKRSTVAHEAIVESSRPGHGPYRVRLMSSGNWTCQCDGYVKGHYVCQHIKKEQSKHGKGVDMK
jgi:hypothetical protein